VLEDRYHFEIVKTPKHCRAALCYVLQNARRHGERLDPSFHGMDPFSSAWTFDGWDADVPEPDDAAEWPRPTPRTRLLKIGWFQQGPLSVGGERATGPRFD